MRIDESPNFRIALIHATPLAMDPIAQAFSKHAPSAEVFHLLEDSLSKDHAKNGVLTPQMMERFDHLARYAWLTQADGILFTCSAFGAAIDACANKTQKPVLKPNQAMFEQALMTHPRESILHVGLVATFEPSIASMSEEFLRLSESLGLKTQVHPYFVPEAMKDLANGDDDLHHQKVSLAMPALEHCDVIMLAQFSMAAAKDSCQATTSVPVLTSPDCAALEMMKRLAQTNNHTHDDPKI